MAVSGTTCRAGLSARSGRSGRHSWLLPLLVGIVLAVALFIRAKDRRDMTVERDFSQMRVAAPAVAAGIEGSFRAQGRRGSLDQGHFVNVLESVVETTGVRFLAVLRGGEVFSAGEVPEGLTANAPDGESWDGAIFTLTRRFVPGRTRGHSGGGPPPWRGGWRRGDWSDGLEGDLECPVLVVGIADEVFVEPRASRAE